MTVICQVHDRGQTGGGAGQGDSQESAEIFKWQEGTRTIGVVWTRERGQSGCTVKLQLIRPADFRVQGLRKRRKGQG